MRIAADRVEFTQIENDLFKHFGEKLTKLAKDCVDTGRLAGLETHSQYGLVIMVLIDETVFALRNTVQFTPEEIGQLICDRARYLDALDREEARCGR